jgi:hypothetical protein
MKNFKLNVKRMLFSAAIMGGAIGNSYAQGAAGINAGASELATYIDPIGNLIMIVGAIVGIIGGIRVYIKWNSGDQDVQKAIMGWFGSCIFLVVVGIIIRAFFGV